MRHLTSILGHPDYNFNHCASIVIPSKSDPIIVGYCGQECTDEQRVFIYFNEKYITFAPKTGNPIIWKYGTKIHILYSRYEDEDSSGLQPLTPVERWKFCSNHHIQLEENELIKRLKYFPDTIEKESKEIPEMFGLLARCQPVEFNNECLIPMYREKDPICHIWTLSSDDHLIFKSSFGAIPADVAGNMQVTSSLGYGAAIQPTLETSDGKLTAYMRNVSRSQKYAWTCTSPDGVVWSDITDKPFIPNENNSLIFINSDDPKHRYIVFNPDRTRSDIRLINLSKKRSIQLGRILYLSERNSYSYPNYAWDKDELHIVHSNCGMIAHHILSKKYLEKVFNL
jgi:hypothetical protein